MIGTILLKNEAKEKMLAADSAKVNEAVRSMKSQFPDEARFQEALHAQGLKEVDLRNSIEPQRQNSVGFSRVPHVPEHQVTYSRQPL